MTWFLKARARQILASQSSLVKKAMKLSKSILFDNEVKLSSTEKEAYTKFEGSNGWVDRFKARYKIASRFITTRCTKNVEEIKNSLDSYFKELNTFIEIEKPLKIYNMDEVAIFLELTNNRTLDIKGKKVIGSFSTGKDKERISLLITASSDGFLLPPFLIFKVSKPRSKTFKDYPAQEIMEFTNKETKDLAQR